MAGMGHVQPKDLAWMHALDAACNVVAQFRGVSGELDVRSQEEVALAVATGMAVLIAEARRRSLTLGDINSVTTEELAALGVQTPVF